MSELRGTIADRPWGTTLASLGLGAQTGQLALWAEDQKVYRIVFARGAVVGASSPLAADSVARIALTSHLLTSTQVPAIARKLVGASEADEIRIVSEAARLTQAQANQLRRRVIAQRAARTFSIDRGMFVIEDGITVPIALDAEIDIRGVIYTGVRLNLSAQRLADDLRQFGVRFTLVAGAALAPFGFTEDEEPILEALRAGTSVAELESARRDLDPRNIQAVLYALASCGLVERSGGGDVIAAREVAAAPTVSRVPTPREPTVSRVPTPREPTVSTPIATSARAPANPTIPPETVATATPPLVARTMTPQPVVARAMTPPPVVSRTMTTLPDAVAGTPVVMQAPDADAAGAPVVSRTMTPPPVVARTMTPPPVIARTVTPPVVARTATPPTVTRVPTEREPTVSRVPTQREPTMSRVPTQREPLASHTPLVPIDPPTLAREAFLRAEKELRADKAAHAVVELRQACELEPSNIDYLAMLGWAQFCAARDKSIVAAQTRRVLNRAIHKSDKPEVARFYLGRVERMLGDDHRALEHFQEVLELVPDHHEAASEIRVIESRLAVGTRPPKTR